jgi:hypothetical protein
MRRGMRDEKRVEEIQDEVRRDEGR